jgi:hypothetical protein
MGERDGKLKIEDSSAGEPYNFFALDFYEGH